MSLIIKSLGRFFLSALLAAALEFGVVLPLAAALIHARLPVPPAGTWFDGNDLDLGLFDFLRGPGIFLPMVPVLLWIPSRSNPRKDIRKWNGVISVVCFLIFGIIVGLPATLAPAHQYQASAEGITFPNASSSRGPLHWSDVTAIELGCIYRSDVSWFSPGHHDPSLVLHFGDTLALDLWEGARRANFLRRENHVEDFIHHFGEVFVQLPPTALAHTVQNNKNCQRDFKKLLPSLTDSAQQGHPPAGG